MLETALAALRERGAPLREPLRWQRLAALARRAEGHEGAVRQLLDARLAALVDELDAALVDHDAAADIGQASQRGPLGDLVDTMRPLPGARIASAPPPDSAARGASAAPAPAPATSAGIESLAWFRQTWARLSADQRVAESASALPGNAGPLHSQHLVHRALLLMREVAPGYLERFVAQVDALMWLEATDDGAIISGSVGNKSSTLSAKWQR